MSDAVVAALRDDDDNSESGSESSDGSTEDENEEEKTDGDEDNDDEEENYDEEENDDDDEETGSLDQRSEEEEEDDDKIGEADNIDQQLSGDDDSEVCPICLNRFLGQELGSPENCDHTFCLQCITEWSKNVNTCPVDRTEFSNILMKLELLGKVVKKVKVKVRSREPEDALPIENTLCEVCRSGNREDRLLLCDSCDLAYHCECLDPPLWRIPVEEWFCPPCARILNRGPHAVGSSRQRRVIPRTIVSETVRTRIQRLREVLDNDDTDDFMEFLPVHPRPSPTKKKPSTSGVVRRRRVVRRRYRRRTPKKPKVLARTKQSVALYGKTRVRIDTGTKTKYRKRRRRRRKTKKRKTATKTTKTRRALLASKPLTAPSTKQRIADHLGLCKPPAGHSMPYVKKSGSSAGENTLLLFGNKYQLIGFEDDSLEETSREVKPPPIPSNPGPSGYSGSALDILGSIMADQSILHKDSTDITIGKDGSLKLKELPTNKKTEAKNGFVKAENKNVLSEDRKTKLSIGKGAISKTETDADGFKIPQPLIKKEKLIKGDQVNSAKQLDNQTFQNNAQFLNHKKELVNKGSVLNNVRSVKSEKFSCHPSTSGLYTNVSSNSSDYRESQDRKHCNDMTTAKESVCAKKIKSEKQETDHHKRKIKAFWDESGKKKNKVSWDESDTSEHQRKEKAHQNHSAKKSRSSERGNVFKETGSSNRWGSDNNSSLHASRLTNVDNSDDDESFLNSNNTLISYANATTTNTSLVTSPSIDSENVISTVNDFFRIPKIKKEKVDYDCGQKNIDIVNNVSPALDRQSFLFIKAEPIDTENVERSDYVHIAENVQQNTSCKSVKSEKVSTPEEVGVDRDNLIKREKSCGANSSACAFESSLCPDPVVPKNSVKLEVSEKPDSESDTDITITEYIPSSKEMQSCNYVATEDSKLAIKSEGKRKLSSQEDSDNEVEVLFQSSSELNKCKTKRKRKFSNNLFPEPESHSVNLSKVKVEKVTSDEHVSSRTVQNSGLENFEEPVSNVMPTSSPFSDRCRNINDHGNLVSGCRQHTTQNKNIMSVQDSVKNKKTVSPHSNTGGETSNNLHNVASSDANNVSLPVNELTNSESNEYVSRFDRSIKSCSSVRGKIKSGCENNNNPIINSTRKKESIMSKNHIHSFNLGHDETAGNVGKSSILGNANSRFENNVDLSVNIKIKKEPTDPENDLINSSSNGSVENTLRNSVSEVKCRKNVNPLINMPIKTEPVEISESENTGFAPSSEVDRNVTNLLENDIFGAKDSAQENIDPFTTIKIKKEPVDSENGLIPNFSFYESLRNLRRDNISYDLQSTNKNTYAQFLNLPLKEKQFKPNGNDGMHSSDAAIINSQEDRTILNEMIQKHATMITSFSDDILSNREPEHENDFSSLNVTIKKEPIDSDDDVAPDINFYKSAEFFQGNRVIGNVISCHENIKNTLNIKKEPMVSDDDISPNCDTNESMKNNADTIFDSNNLNSSIPYLNITIKKEPTSSDNHDVNGVKKLSFQENSTLNAISIKNENSINSFNVEIKKEPLDSDGIIHCKIKLEPEEDVNLNYENNNPPIDVQIKKEKPYFDNENNKHDFGNMRNNLTEENVSTIPKQAQQSSIVKVKKEKSEGKIIVPHKNPFDFLEKSANTDQRHLANGIFPTHKQKIAKKEEKERSVILPEKSLNVEMPVKINRKHMSDGHLSHNGEQTNIISRSSCKTETLAKTDEKIFTFKRPDENNFTQSDAVQNRTKVSSIKQEVSTTLSETDRKSSQKKDERKIQSGVCDINRQPQMPNSPNESDPVTVLLKLLRPLQEEDHMKITGDNLENDRKNHRRKMGKEELEKKVKNEIAKILHPLYKNGTLTKKLYFDIERKCLLKILTNCKGVFNPEKIKKLVCEYVTKMTKVSKSN